MADSLTTDERRELDVRTQLIGHHRLTLQLLESEQALYLNHLLTSRGLDPAKRYSIGGDGELTEVDDG